MMRRSAVLRRTPLVAAAAAAALLATAASAAAARPAPTSVPTARERADYHASLQTRPALPARFQAGLVGPRAAALPRFDPAVLSTTLTGPILVYGQSAFINPTDLAQTIVAKNLGTGTTAALIPISTSICPYEARMSPDGTKVAYLDFGPNCGDPGVLTVLTIAAGTTSAVVTPPSNGFLQLPNWSPDSAKILYTQETDDSKFLPLSDELFTVPPSGGSSTPILGGGLSAYDGVYSPDGTKIAFAQYATSDATNLAVMDANGANVVDLSSTSQPTYSPSRPAWSPDGTLLTYTYFKNKVGNTYTDGIGIAHVDDSNAGGLGVTGATTSDSFFSAWSADGTEIFYDAQTLSGNGDPATNDTLFATDAVGHRRATLATDPVHAYTSPSYVGPGLPASSASTFTPIPPTRLLARTPLGPGGVLDVQVTGAAGIPAGAKAVTLNLTGIGPSAPTYLQAYPTPSDSSAPLVSNLNLVPGQVSAVAVQVALSSDGKVRIRNQAGTTGVIVDVSGFFVSGTGADAYSPITPVRTTDTMLAEGQHTDVDLTSLEGGVTGLVPVAVVLNLTGAHPTKATYLSAYPTPASGDAVPLVSNLNLKVDETRANLVTVQIGDANRVRIYNAVGTVRAIADVVGFYGTGATGGLSYYPLTPTRFLDTRNGTDTHFGQTTPVPAATSLSLQLRGSATTSSGMITMPATAKAYVYNLTAVGPTAATYLTAFPFAAGLPTASTVNAPAHGVVPNLAITGGDASGLIGVYNRVGSTAVLLDVAGYYAP